MLALHVYIALCYYKLDYYDVSQEVLAVYLQKVTRFFPPPNFAETKENDFFFRLAKGARFADRHQLEGVQHLPALQRPQRRHGDPSHRGEKTQ